MNGSAQFMSMLANPFDILTLDVTPFDVLSFKLVPFDVKGGVKGGVVWLKSLSIDPLPLANV
jgi:hypothetical protein